MGIIYTFMSSSTSLAPVLQTGSGSTSAPRKTDVQEVIRQLERMCDELEPGTRLPSRDELMRRFDASQRSVLKALDELQRRNRLVIRNGSGTYVADFQAPNQSDSLIGTRTIVAIARPDRSVFDYAMSSLYSHVENAELALVARFVESADSFGPVPQVGENSPLGYIVFGRDLTSLAQALQSAGNRVVMVGSPHTGEDLGVPNVRGDHETGGYMVMNHLIELGHRRIAFYGSDNLRQHSRHKGHERATREAKRRGIIVETQMLPMATVANWNGQAARDFFCGPQAPTAVAAWNDHEAVALLGVLGRAGISVPGEVSLMGYDNLIEGQRIHPALSTVEVAMDQQLRAALDVLAAPQAASPNHNVIVLPSLVQPRFFGAAAPLKARELFISSGALRPLESFTKFASQPIVNYQENYANHFRS